MLNLPDTTRKTQRYQNAGVKRPVGNHQSSTKRKEKENVYYGYSA